MSLHSDILPKAYCDELVKLNYDVTPMPFSEVEEVINRSYREDWHQYFKTIDQEPLGSASIAQVHRAVLLTGEEVVVKVPSAQDRAPDAFRGRTQECCGSGNDPG